MPIGDLPVNESDGVYKVGLITHGAKFLRVRAELSGEYRRWTLDDGETIVFKKV
jgi:hypothetical protein